MGPLDRDRPAGTLRVLALMPGLAAYLVRDPATGWVGVRLELGATSFDAAIDETPAKLADLAEAAPGSHALQRFRGATALALGQLGAARHAFEQAARAAEPPDRPVDLLALATVALEQGDLDAAWRAAEQAAELAGGAYQAARADALRADVLAYRGEAVQAEAMMAGALARLWRAGMQGATAEAVLGWAWTQLRTGRPEGAAEQAEKLAALAPPDEPVLAEALDRLQAAIAGAQGDPGAGARLESLVEEARRLHHALRLAELLRWLAPWRRHMGDAAGAEAARGEAATLATRAGHGRLARELAGPSPQAAGPAPEAPQTAQVLAAGLAGVTARLDATAAARQALAALVALLGAQRGFMVLYDGLSIAEVIAYGEDARDPDAFSTGLAEHVVWTGEAVFIDDLQAHPALGLRDSIQGLGLRSAFGLPLSEAGALIGVMIADSREPMTAPDEELRAAAISLGRYATLAVTSARALAGQAREAAEQAVGHQVALAATRARSFADLLPTLGSAAGACGAERILLLLGEGLEVAAAIDTEGHSLRPELSTFSRTIARCVLESGQPLHLADPLADSSFASHASVQGLGGRTVDVVPIRAGEAILGVLYTDHPGEVIEGPAPMAALAGMAEAIGALLARLAP